MAKSIDRLALGAGFAAFCYLLFLKAWGSIPLACAMALLCCVLAETLLRGLPVPKRVSRDQANAEILRLATIKDEEAESEMWAVIRRRYPGEAFALAAVLKHPEASMNSGDVLNTWKAHREVERLVIVSTCPCEPRAALFASQLHAPAVAVVDSRGLYRILRGLPTDALPSAQAITLRQRLRRLAAGIASSRVSPRNFMVAAALLSAYLLGGNPLYLFASLAVLAHLGIALLHRRVGRKLFTNTASP